MGWLLATSCENEIDLKLQERTPKLVMNALINSDSINNVLYLNLTGPYRMAHVSDATVEVQVNGTLVETPEAIPPATEDDKQKRFLITHRFRPGDVVRIDARTADGVYHAWAETTVPQPATINRVDTMTVRKEHMYNRERLLQFKINIQDRPNEKNFYRLAIDQHRTFESYRQIYHTLETNYISREDIVLTDGQPSFSEDTDLLSPVKNVYGVFDDYRFANKDYTMTVYTDDWWERYSYPFSSREAWWCYLTIDIRLLSITEMEYRYLKLLNIIDSGDFDEAIDEQILFPTNVQGGTGLVSISSETSVRIHVIRDNVPEEYIQ